MMTGHGRFSNRPLYLQVRDLLVTRIVRGEWNPGQMLPSEPDLARELGVSQGTVRKALALLEEAKLISRQPGRGTVVNDAASESVAIRFSNVRDAGGARISPPASTITAEIREGNQKEIERLQLDERDQVIFIRRARQRQGHTMMVEDVALPGVKFPGLLEQPKGPDRITVIAQRYGIAAGRAEERVFISRAASDVASILGIEEGTAVLTLDRVVFALDGPPIEWRMGYCSFGDEYYLAETS
jgi:GntR family transcriptional regulator